MRGANLVSKRDAIFEQQFQIIIRQKKIIEKLQKRVHTEQKRKQKLANHLRKMNLLENTEKAVPNQRRKNK